MVPVSADRTTDLLHAYTVDLATCTPLSPEKERELAVQIKQGDLEARNRLVVANLRFVMRVAKGYQNLGLPLSDLIGAGNLGLIKAAERFDEEKGFRFITYAVWWIRQSIQQAIAQHARTIRLPASRVELLRKIVQFSEEEPRDDPQGDIAIAFNLTRENVADLLCDMQPIMSLDVPFHPDDSFCLKEKLSGPQTGADASLFQNALQDGIASALNLLDAREKEVICLYFGLDGAPQMTLLEIGMRFQLSRERVRQIKAHALRKLRHHPDMRLLVRNVHNN